MRIVKLVFLLLQLLLQFLGLVALTKLNYRVWEILFSKKAFINPAFQNYLALHSGFLYSCYVLFRLDEYLRYVSSNEWSTFTTRYMVFLRWGVHSCNYGVFFSRFFFVIINVFSHFCICVLMLFSFLIVLVVLYHTCDSLCLSFEMPGLFGLLNQYVRLCSVIIFTLYLFKLCFARIISACRMINTDVLYVRYCGVIELGVVFVIRLLFLPLDLQLNCIAESYSQWNNLVVINDPLGGFLYYTVMNWIKHPSMVHARLGYYPFAQLLRPQVVFYPCGFERFYAYKANCLKSIYLYNSLVAELSSVYRTFFLVLIQDGKYLGQPITWIYHKNQLDMIVETSRYKFFLMFHPELQVYCECNKPSWWEYCLSKVSKIYQIGHTTLSSPVTNQPWDRVTMEELNRYTNMVMHTDYKAIYPQFNGLSALSMYDKSRYSKYLLDLSYSNYAYTRSCLSHFVRSICSNSTKIDLGVTLYSTLALDLICLNFPYLQPAFGLGGITLSTLYSGTILYRMAYNIDSSNMQFGLFSLILWHHTYKLMMLRQGK